MNWSFQKLKEALFGKKTQDREKLMASFHRLYLPFKELLQANADLALILSRLTGAQNGETTLETRVVRKLSRRAIARCKRMVENLNVISGNKFPALAKSLLKISARIEAELRKHAKGDLKTVAIPLSEADASMAYILGGKSANLGEARNILGMPVPRGFAMTTKSGALMLMRNGDLFYRVYAEIGKIDADKPKTIREGAKAIARLIEGAPLPKSLLEPALKAWDHAFGKDAESVKAAVRSSAVAEDGAQSFAGQYESVLNVGRAELGEAIKKVMASLYSERALAYRAAHGYPLDATGMGLCVLEMVDACAAGVAFSRHPVDLRSNSILVHGAFGLGESVVDGSIVPDQWEISRASNKILQSRAGAGKINSAGGEGACAAPCLSCEQAQKIAEMALALEKHYHYPQDVEWAVDKEGKIFLLQTRPLGIDCASPFQKSAECHLPRLQGVQPILSGGDIAAKGVACGPIVRVHPNEELPHFPEGAILLAENSSPNIMSVLQKAGGVIAENGSLTGHLASVCREFGIPALFNLPGAIKALKEGEIVTLDALGGRVYSGEIKELLELKLSPQRKPAQNTAGMAMLRRVSPYILPLHLLEPRSENFIPENCASLHDIMRFAHEKSYAEMFQISDNLSESGSEGVASKLVCRAPLDLYVIDLGGGLKNPGAPTATVEDVASAPFKSLLDGMLNPALTSNQPRPINFAGFLSVMKQSVAGGNLAPGERFGDRSYAIVSDKYLNFSSRVGYHYAILDSWRGNTINKNYIRFEFAGGAAGDEQRARRARCIGLILDRLGFTIDVAGDRIKARFQKYPEFEIGSRLDQLGRLLIMTRQMDMLMVNEAAVEMFANNFLEGKYH